MMLIHPLSMVWELYTYGKHNSGWVWDSDFGWLAFSEFSALPEVTGGTLTVQVPNDNR